MMAKFLALAFLLCVLHVSSLGVEPGSLRADGLINPLGIPSAKPRLSWRLQSDTRNDNQTAYQIQIATSATRLDSPNLWDSGKVQSSDVSVVYSGEELGSRDLAWFRVKVWDARNESSLWSNIGSFEVGLLESSDWVANWIENKDYIPEGGTSLPVFAKNFRVASAVTRARLYLLGLG